jgi:maleylpyruvate isomerase
VTCSVGRAALGRVGGRASGAEADIEMMREMVRQASGRLLRAADALGDDDLAAPSALPEWTRAELLTHVARNADGFRRMADGTRDGTVPEMYPSGGAGRAADIAAGRRRSAGEVLPDLHRSIDALYDTWQRLPADRWDAVGRTLAGERTIAATVTVRLREVEIHHVDLDVGYAPADWPVAFVARELDEALRTLSERPVPGRPDVDARYRIEAVDHSRSWTVVLHGARVAVHEDDKTSNAPRDADAVVSGWGCDLLAWLYGRDAGTRTLIASGHDVSAWRLSTWFPYS